MIKIDKEFKELIPALSVDEKTALEENIKKEGCRDALVLWGETLIDGHNRYEICSNFDGCTAFATFPIERILHHPCCVVANLKTKPY